MELDAYLSEKQKKRKKKRLILRAALAFLAAYLLFTGIGWFILRSPFFAVTKVEVKGNSVMSSDAVIALMQSSALRGKSTWRSFLGFRNMFLWPSALSMSDLVFAPQLASISIAKDYFSHTITAQVTERAPFAIWCSMPPVNAAGNSAGDKFCYWFDGTGTIFSRTYDTEGSLMVSLHDYSGRKLGLGKKILPDEFTGNVISVANALRASTIGVREILLNDLSREEVTVTTANGPTLYFSLRFPADGDLPVLESLMAKPGFQKLQYIDFRVENRAYYK